MTDWKPTITDPGERARIVAVIAESDAALAHVETRSDLLDRALLRAYASDLLADADEDDSLARALDLDEHGGMGLGLFGGLAQVGWTVAHLAEGEDADEVTGAIDERFARELETREAWTGDYDLVSGLAGFGVYALERGDAGRALAVRVLEQLERLARPRGAGITWFTRPELLFASQRADAPEGCWNLGVAHGAAGVIGLLARYVAAGVEPVRARACLEGTMAFLLAAEPADRDGRYPPWYVEGHGSQPPPSTRLAWCYNDLGTALALLSAARACDRGDWLGEALELARRCARRSVEAAEVIESGLCHGRAGAAHQFHRLYQATHEQVFADATRRWLDRLLAKRGTDDTSLLRGSCGMALVLAALVSDREPSWDRLILVDL